MDILQYFFFDISFDVRSIIEVVRNGYSYPRHSKSLYFLFSILNSEIKIYAFNTLAFAIATTFFFLKKRKFLFLAAIIFLGLITRLPLYYLKDNFLVYFLIIFFGLISFDKPHNKIYNHDYFILLIFCFFAIMHSQFYLTIIAPVFIILIKFKYLEINKAIIGLFSIIITIITLNSIAPEGDKYYKPKLVNTYAGDIKNIFLNKGNFSIDKRLLNEDIKNNKDLENCIKSSEPLFEIMAPEGVINADPFFINNCFSINEPKLSSVDIIKSYTHLFIEYPVLLINTKLKHLYQLIIKPGEIEIKWFIKILLGPLLYLILTAYFLFHNKNKIIFICLLSFLPHFILIILIGPGYDLRYTFPQLFLGYILLTYLLHKKFLKLK